MSESDQQTGLRMKQFWQNLKGGGEMFLLILCLFMICLQKIVIWLCLKDSIMKSQENRLEQSNFKHLSLLNLSGMKSL